MRTADKIMLINQIKGAARYFFESNNFTECDTPILMKGNGELYNEIFSVDINGQNRVLADSPQLYKMLLFMDGITRYFQFAHCFRPICNMDDGTRTSEFMQIDVETEAEDIDELMELARKLLECILEKVNKRVNYTYMEGKECRKIYGNEMKPDLRRQDSELEVVFIRHMPLTNGEAAYSAEAGDSLIAPCHHIFAKPTADICATDKEALCSMTTESFDIVINGIEVGGGDIRIMDASLLKKMMDIFKVNKTPYKEYFKMLENYNGSQEAGFALGLERLAMVINSAGNIREVSVF